MTGSPREADGLTNNSFSGSKTLTPPTLPCAHVETAVRLDGQLVTGKKKRFNKQITWSQK
jgi:hypothetical protein